MPKKIDPSDALERLERWSFNATITIFVGVVVEAWNSIQFRLPEENWLDLASRLFADALIGGALLVEAYCIVRAIVATRQEKLEADAKVADANRRAEKARLATETLMAENLRLQTALQPRIVALLGRNGDASIRGPKLDELKRHAGTQLLIQIVPDFEAQKLGAAIHGLAKFVGWNAQEVVAVPQGNIREGVVIITLVPPPQTLKKAEAAVPPPAARALLEFLQMDLGPPYGPVLPFGVMWTPVVEGTERFQLGDFRLPAGAILVLVGTKPIMTAFIGSAAEAPRVPTKPLR